MDETGSTDAGVAAAPSFAPAPVATVARRTVAPERQCPICYHGPDNGIGISKTSRKKMKTSNTKQRYYACDKCSMTWHVPVTTTIGPIVYHDIDLETR